MASVVDLKSKEEKDAELDRKIEALRKKNEALVRRHQLIEEDRKRAELEGIAVTTPRKAKQPEAEPDKARKDQENFAVTLSGGEKWVVNDRKSPKSSPHSETSPKSPTSRSSGRTGLFSEGRPQHKEWSEEDRDVREVLDRPTRGRRNQGSDGPRRGARGAEDVSAGERWPPSSKGGSSPVERGGRGSGTSPGERGGRGFRTPLAERADRGGGTPGRGGPGGGGGGPGGGGTPGRGGPGGGGTPGRGGPGVGGPGGGGTLGRGGGPGGGGEGGTGPDRKVKEWEEKRRLNIEMMNEEMEKIAEYERSQRDGVREKNPIRNFLDDPRRSGPSAEGDRKEGSRRHNRNWGGIDFEKVKTGMDRDKETHVRRPMPRNQMDMTMSMTGRERAEYVRWKKEREQIDQERLARHRKPTGQWRREWDAEKTDSMFKNDDTPHVEEEPASRRDKGKHGVPKPPTMGEFLPESLTDPRKKRAHARGRSNSYSMHDRRWEEPEDQPQREELAEGEEKETCVEKPAERMGEKPQKPAQTKEMVEMVDEDEEGEEEGDEEDAWESASGDEEEVVGSSIEDLDPVKEDYSTPSPVTPQPPSKEQRPPRHTETPKLTMPLPTSSPEEEIGKPTPTTPFSPDGYQPVSDWGEEMEMLSPRESSNEDSPPQVTERESGFESRSRRDSSPNGPPSGLPLVEDPKQNIEGPVQNLSNILESASVEDTDTEEEETQSQERPLDNVATSITTPTHGGQAEEAEDEATGVDSGSVLLITDSTMQNSNVPPSS